MIKLYNIWINIKKNSKIFKMTFWFKRSMKCKKYFKNFKMIYNKNMNLKLYNSEYNRKHKYIKNNWFKNIKHRFNCI